jgi:hypothetical protein
MKDADLKALCGDRNDLRGDTANLFAMQSNDDS